MHRHIYSNNKTNKKLSYRRDSARRRSLHRSRSFKVINVGTNRKPACDLLLVNNTNFHPVLHNFHPILHLFLVIAQNWSSCRLRQEGASR